MAGYAAGGDYNSEIDDNYPLYDDSYMYSNMRGYGRPDYMRDQTPDVELTAPSQRDPSIIITPAKPAQLSKDNVQKLANIGVGFASLISNTVLAHPCTVLRRQCQVHEQSRRYHLLPFSLVPVVINLQSHQGISTLWKGISSVFVVQGLQLGCEDVLSKVTPLPKEIHQHSTLKNVLQHLTLKMISFSLTTSFYSASIIETVQSEVTSEKPGMFDVLREGILRIFRLGSRAKSTRLLPIWVLVGPTTLYFVLNYVVCRVVEYLTGSLYAHRDAKAKERGEPDTSSPLYRELMASFVSHMVADVLLFPVETVINRIHLQGTRTIIDNLDTGTTVLPVLTRYEGATDCFNSIVRNEGSSGLYKGFGALLLQYLIQGAVLKLTKLMYDELLNKRAANNR